ncbi:MAG TPA: hypothetical protein VJT78_01905 [Candidatus Dormibacteraeota bacterium]|nr:hypothetical protein [Candidatus Dormibacteraeota bacterium]
MSATQVIDRELDRLENLWGEGLQDAYRSYLGAVGAYESDRGPKLALAAALIEVGIGLHGLGGRAAPPATLLMGDLCLARSSRLLADVAPQRLQVAFARAVQDMAAAAASESAVPAPRELLLRAFEAAR